MRWYLTKLAVVTKAILLRNVKEIRSYHSFNRIVIEYKDGRILTLWYKSYEDCGAEFKELCDDLTKARKS